MSSSFNGLTVIFEKEMSEEYVAQIVAAIFLMRGVCEVRPHIADFDSVMASDRARYEMKMKMIEVLK